jgi:C1A family cysteine protease
VRPTGYQQVDRNNVTDLKIAVSNGPVSALIEADRQVFRLYQRGILNTDKCGVDADHSVAIVGWGRDMVNRLDYWIVKNTWGVGWGEQGYARIAIYEGVGVCGIQQLAFYPTF